MCDFLFFFLLTRACSCVSTALNGGGVRLTACTRAATKADALEASPQLCGRSLRCLSEAGADVRYGVDPSRLDNVLGLGWRRVACICLNHPHNADISPNLRSVAAHALLRAPPGCELLLTLQRDVASRIGLDALARDAFCYIVASWPTDVALFPGWVPSTKPGDKSVTYALRAVMPEHLLAELRLCEAASLRARLLGRLRDMGQEDDMCAHLAAGLLRLDVHDVYGVVDDDEKLHTAALRVLEEHSGDEA